MRSLAPPREERGARGRCELTAGPGRAPPLLGRRGGQGGEVRTHRKAGSPLSSGRGVRANSAERVRIQRQRSKTFRRPLVRSAPGCSPSAAPGRAPSTCACGRDTLPSGRCSGRQWYGLNRSLRTNSICSGESKVCRGIRRTAAGTRGETLVGHITAAFSMGMRNGSVWTWRKMSNSTSCLASVAAIASRR